MTCVRMQIKPLNMSSATKGDRKTALDVASWMFNIVTSVGIILVNKALMATYGFSFGIEFLDPFSSLIIYSTFILFSMCNVHCFELQCIRLVRLLVLVCSINLFLGFETII